MDLDTVYFHTLLRDELIYEVNIRAEVPESTVPKLKKQLKHLCLGFSPADFVDDELDLEAELLAVKEKISELKTKLDLVEKTREPYVLSRVKALFCHLHHRVQRLLYRGPADSSSFQDFRTDFSTISTRVHRCFGKGSEEVKPNEADLNMEMQVSGNKHFNFAKWNIVFDGQSSPHSFLDSVNERVSAYKVPDKVIFDSAFVLFKDQALLWYRGVKGQVSSWSELSKLLLEEFAPVDFDYRLLGEIRARTQGQSEPIHIYFAVMNCMFSRLQRSLSDEDKLEILMHNIRPVYTEQLALVNVTSIAELKEYCRKIEAARLKSSLFAEPKDKCSVGLEFVPKSVKPQKSQAAAVQQSPVEQNKRKFYKKGNSHKKDSHKLSDSGQGGNKPVKGSKKALKCYKCGKADFTVKTCPDCNKNVPKNA